MKYITSPVIRFNCEEFFFIKSNYNSFNREDIYSFEEYKSRV